MEITPATFSIAVLYVIEVFLLLVCWGKLNKKGMVMRSLFGASFIGLLLIRSWWLFLGMHALHLAIWSKSGDKLLSLDGTLEITPRKAFVASACYSLCLYMVPALLIFTG